MRAALHVLATLVVVPYVILATGFLVLGHSIAGGSILSFFDRMLNHAVWLVPWGVIGLACIMTLVALAGAIQRFRRLGAICLAVLAGASLAVILFASTSPVDYSQLFFLLPCMLVLMFALWCAVRKG
jgi:hypothetical protein